MSAVERLAICKSPGFTVSGMKPFMNFRADPRRKLLCVEMAGFFGLDAVSEYAEQRRAAFD